MQMRPFTFAETIPSNESVASMVTLLVCAWFTAAGAAMLAEPTVDQQLRSFSAKTPVVTVRQVATFQAPEVRETIHVVAQRTGPGVS
jgi:hypothetical protein